MLIPVRMLSLWLWTFEGVGRYKRTCRNIEVYHLQNPAGEDFSVCKWGRKLYVRWSEGKLAGLGMLLPWLVWGCFPPFFFLEAFLLCSFCFHLELLFSRVSDFLHHLYHSAKQLQLAGLTPGEQLGGRSCSICQDHDGYSAERGWAQLPSGSGCRMVAHKFVILTERQLLESRV